MRLATFIYQEQEQIGAVTVKGSATQLIPIRQFGRFPGTMQELIEAGPPTWRDLEEALGNEAAGLIPLDGVQLLAPIPRPRKNVMCLGLNYADHASETKATLPEHLVVFTKSPTAVNSPYGDVPYDPAVSKQIDWEVELGVIIGRPGRQIAPENAMDHVFGYTVVDDISARDIQRQHKQYFLGKSLDGACPLGPWIVTAGDIGDPHALTLRTRVNGVLKQEGTTADLVFDIPQAIAILSRGMSLEPGDIIATGTPAGVGFARTPPEFLQPGDVVECEVEGIGTIRNRVVNVKNEGTN